MFHNSTFLNLGKEISHGKQATQLFHELEIIEKTKNQNSILLSSGFFVPAIIVSIILTKNKCQTKPSVSNKRKENLSTMAQQQSSFHSRASLGQRCSNSNPKDNRQGTLSEKEPSDSTHRPRLSHRPQRRNSIVRVDPITQEKKNHKNSHRHNHKKCLPSANESRDSRPHTRSQRRNSIVRVDKAKTTTSSSASGMNITSTSTTTTKQRCSDNYESAEKPRKPLSMSSLKLPIGKKSKTGADSHVGLVSTSTSKHYGKFEEDSPRKPKSMPSLKLSKKSLIKINKSKAITTTTITKTCSIHQNSLFGETPEAILSTPTEEAQSFFQPSKSLRAFSSSIKKFFCDESSKINSTSTQKPQKRPLSFRRMSKKKKKAKEEEQKRQQMSSRRKIIVHLQ